MLDYVGFEEVKRVSFTRSLDITNSVLANRPEDLDSEYALSSDGEEDIAHRSLNLNFSMLQSNEHQFMSQQEIQSGDPAQASLPEFISKINNLKVNLI
jgi:hypothetical protein